jgi:D-galactarolactone cycloisomerase
MSHGIAVIPHVWGSGIAVAAALHAVATVPPFPYTANALPFLNEPVIEFDRKHNPLRDELLEELFTLVDGCLAVPDRPGLGVKVNDDGLAAYSNN